MTTTTTSSPADTAAAIEAEARTLGFAVIPDAKAGILTVSTQFYPGDVDAFRQAERDAYRILRLIRMTRPGTVWGTDSGSVGGHVGLRNGYVELHKSGADKRVLSLLAKARGW